MPALIFSAGRRLLDLPNLQKARIRAILDLRTGVAPARKLTAHCDQAHDEHTGSRGTCAERSAISRRDGLSDSRILGHQIVLGPFNSITLYQILKSF
jgi:hypothetical protein